MLLINYARSLRELGLYTDAAQYAERGHKIAAAANDQVVVNQSLLLLASLYRNLSDLKRATALLDEVEPRMRHALPPAHIGFGSLLSERSQLAQAGGDMGKALDFANRAVDLVDASLKRGGPGNQVLPILLLRRADLEFQTGELRAAETDISRALAILRDSAPAGSYSATLGQAYLMQARALAANGKREEARASKSVAVEHLRNALGENNYQTQRARDFVVR